MTPGSNTATNCLQHGWKKEGLFCTPVLTAFPLAAKGSPSVLCPPAIPRGQPLSLVWPHTCCPSAAAQVIREPGLFHLHLKEMAGRASSSMKPLLTPPRNKDQILRYFTKMTSSNKFCGGWEWVSSQKQGFLFQALLTLDSDNSSCLELGDPDVVT